MTKRYFLVAILLVLTLLACCAVALADDGIEVPPTELISDNPNFSIVDWRLNVMPLADELKLVRMTASIAKSDSTHVAVRGVTQTNKLCWHINGNMNLLQWKNNKWNAYKTASYSVFGSEEGSRETTLVVESGYYYCLVVDHFATDYDGNSVVGSTTTKSILVN